MVHRITSIFAITFFTFVSQNIHAQINLTGSRSWLDPEVHTLLQNETHFHLPLIENAAHFWYKKESLHVPTWSPVYHVLTDLINEYDLKVGCELGVAFGTQSIAVLELKQADTQEYSVQKWYSCDPYQVYKERAFRKATQQTWDVLHAMVNMRLSRFGNRATLIRKTSVEASKLIEDNSLDILYVDGDHSYHAVKQDLELWFDKVRAGGFIVGDDYSKEFPGLKRAVQEFVKQHNLTLTFATPRTYVIRKPKN